MPEWQYLDAKWAISSLTLVVFNGREQSSCPNQRRQITSFFILERASLWPSAHQRRSPMVGV